VVNNGNRPGKTPGQHTKINERDGAEMVWIPACTYQMGLSDMDNNPVHTVSLDGYYIYKYPVTVGQYRRFCAAAGSFMPATPEWGWQEDHPIVNVSWNDAVAYCKWAGVRLPTEAEWEHAARGPNNYKFPWGNEFDISKCVNSVNPDTFNNKGRKIRLNKRNPNELTSTAKVGRYPANDFGLYDMAGNVWHWCMDHYEEDFWKPGEDYDNPVNCSSDQRIDRVLRGGGWVNGFPEVFSASIRDSFLSEYYGDIIGFRCASQN
jgi:formylglycine-generating enzyme